MAYKETKLNDKNEAAGFLSLLGADNARTVKKSTKKTAAAKKPATTEKRSPAKKPGK